MCVELFCFYPGSILDTKVGQFQMQINNLWLTRSGNDLVISRVGTADKVNISNWYSGASYQLDKIEVDSATLLNSQINQLVNAMAAFAPPVGVGSVLSQDTKDQLQPVLAATWQSS